jgi:beta-glucosidase
MRKLESTIMCLCFLLSTFISAPSQSPAPSSSSTSLPPPDEVERRVEAILGRMTLEEKIDMLGGVDGFFIPELTRLGVPRMKMADGPLGVRNFGPATAMAGGIALAATWNRELAGRVGTELGRDARAKGVHFLLGPGVNIATSSTSAKTPCSPRASPWTTSVACRARA